MLDQSLRLADPAVRAPVEQLVSAHTGRRWAATAARDMTDFACHPCAILSGGAVSVFAKFSDAANGHEQFEIELAGLMLLATRAGVRTPTPIGVARVEGGSVLVMEAINAVERGPQHWRHIGQALARLHRVKGDTFGLHTNGYFGPLPQDNTPAEDWPAFFVERRLQPGLRLAVESGRVPPEVIRQVEKLIARAPQLCGPTVAPTLLHGDGGRRHRPGRLLRPPGNGSGLRRLLSTRARGGLRRLSGRTAD